MTRVSLLLLTLALLQLSPAAEIVLPDYRLEPDGGNGNTTFQHTDIKSLNGDTSLLPLGERNTVYVISTFTFGSASKAHLQWQFSISPTVANRLGIEIQDTGLVQTLATNTAIVHSVGPRTPSRTHFQIDGGVAGQTITVLAKLRHDPNLAETMDARMSTNGTQIFDTDTLMHVWINPDSSDTEGEGLVAGDLYALWNSYGFDWFRQTIQNQSTPAGAGESSITKTIILTGEDATFAKALSLAIGGEPPTPDPMSWKSAPKADGSSSITMTAATASHGAGVEYFFEETSGNAGGTSSTWQASPTYTDTGLKPGKTYSYTVKSRSKDAAKAETASSAEASATTRP